MSSVTDNVLLAARTLASAVDRQKFGPPVSFVYNPLSYAWTPHARYIERFARGPKRVIFLGMNPGPFGMMQTGVPFGEIASVREWMGIEGPVTAPSRMHPKRPVQGFACLRSEVSGRRLWGLFAQRFGNPDSFFDAHFVVNYCPLAFLDEGGRNLTPDKFPARDTLKLFAACDEHLRAVVEALEPEWVIGVGDFAVKRAEAILAAGAGAGAGAGGVRIGRILHPSPASPAANRDWAGAATAQLQALGVWR